MERDLLRNRGMLRSLRAAPAVAVIFVAAAFACGEDPDADGGGGGLVVGPDGSVQPLSTCSRDSDCKNGGKCKDIGAAGKVCVVAKSCTGGAGADAKCGGKPGDEKASGSQDCCETRAVAGGTYNRFNNPRFPATVGPFALDAFEVTVGRFRAWVEASNGNLRSAAPAEGAGAHPKIPNSGWRKEWDKFLPASRAEIDKMFGPTGEDGVGCQVGTNLDDYGAMTWWTPAIESKVKSENQGADDVLAENTKEALDRKPLNCVGWHVLFAFCAWDGGRLPTDAEWGFAGSGGEQRVFPWGNVDKKDLVLIGENNSLSWAPTFAAGGKYVTAALWERGKPNEFPEFWDVHTWGKKMRTKSDNAAHIAPVGRKAAGNGKWGHANLSGGMFEWMLDEGPIKQGNCVDCANVGWPGNEEFDKNATQGPPDFEQRWFKGGARAVRGGAWDTPLGLSLSQTDVEIDWYTSYPVLRTYRSLGGRCARDL